MVFFFFFHHYISGPRGESVPINYSFSRVFMHVLSNILHAILRFATPIYS